MKVVASSCGCCAIKHIRDFPGSPDYSTSVAGESGHDEDQSSTTPEPYDDFCDTTDSSVFPTGYGTKSGDVFKALVAQIKRRRPAGMITLNLVENADDDYLPSEDEYWDDSQVSAWHPLLTDEGFTKVVFLNSNSSNRIHHYTLVYDEGGWE